MRISLIFHKILCDEREDEFYLIFFLKYRFYSTVRASLGVNEDIDVGTWSILPT